MPNHEENGDEDDDDGDQDENDDEEEKVMPHLIIKTKDEWEDEGDLNDEDFYSKLGNTAVVSRQDLAQSALEGQKQNKADIEVIEQRENATNSTLETKKMIRGKVQLIVDETSL